MSIEDIEIKIKKYDRNKNVVIANIILCNEVVIRGFVVRYTITKYSHGNPVWIVSPPSIKKRNSPTYFWIVEFRTIELWKELQERIIESAKEYVNNI